MKTIAALAFVAALVLTAVFLRPKPDPRLVAPDGTVADGVLIGGEFVRGPNWDGPRRQQRTRPVAVEIVMSKKDVALDTLRVLVGDFLTRGSQENEPISVSDLIDSGDLTRAEILRVFEEELDQRLRPRE